jgi:hypothetical protein
MDITLLNGIECFVSCLSMFARTQVQSNLSQTVTLGTTTNRCPYNEDYIEGYSDTRADDKN